MFPPGKKNLVSSQICKFSQHGDGGVIKSCSFLPTIRWLPLQGEWQLGSDLLALILPVLPEWGFVIGWKWACALELFQQEAACENPVDQSVWKRESRVFLQHFLMLKVMFPCFFFKSEEPELSDSHIGRFRVFCQIFAYSCKQKNKWTLNCLYLIPMWI